MAPYSMDLRKRVAKAWDASGDADAVAAQCNVSRGWVHRLSGGENRIAGAPEQGTFRPIG
jgi:hypothetical protein